jgi:hypothetical protein
LKLIVACGWIGHAPPCGCGHGLCDVDVCGNGHGGIDQPNIGPGFVT